MSLLTLGIKNMKNIYINSWAALCVLPSLFPAYMLFLYRAPGAANFGWEMVLGFGLFWGSVTLAIILALLNLILLLKSLRSIASLSARLLHLGLNLITFGLAHALLR